MTPNCNKRVTLNRRRSSLLLDYQAMLRTSTTTAITTKHSYTHNTLVSNGLQPPNELPRLLKSSLRTPKSAPCTPSIVKTVQFHDQLEQICLFRKAQTPSAISQTNIFWDDHSSSDEEQDDQLYTTSLVYANWPTRLADIIDRKKKVIRVEKNNIKLVDQDYIQGKISVRNLSYHKLVTIRYTFDFWESFDNVHAQFYTSQSSYDFFDFTIHLPKNATHLYFAVNYKVGNQEFWDNNDGRNYEIQFVSKPSNKLNKSEDESTVAYYPTTTTNTKEQLKARYDFSQSIHQAKSTLEPFYKSVSDITQMKTVLQPQAQPAAIPIPISSATTRRKNTSSPISCNSPLASSPSFMDLNSQSYLDLVNKYCFYSTSPSRSPVY